MSALLEHAGAREGGVLEVMSTLEGMMDAEPFSATYLMASLYPIAARRREHAICDAVNLWMHSPLPSMSIEALRKLAQEGMRLRFEQQLSAWIAALEATCRSAAGDRDESA